MRIEGMTCEGCNETVAEALTAAGAEKVRGDFQAGKATFEPAAADEATLIAAVDAAGYHVVSVDDTEEHSHGPTHRRGPRPNGELDLIVVGSGSGAFAAAIRATDLGASVGLCEANTVGGTCVNVGCVPSKAMLAAADLYHRAGHNPFDGATTTAGTVDLATLVAAKDELVDRLRYDKYEHLADDYGFTLLCGYGEFTDANTFTCDGQEIHAGQYLVATGASPAVPPIPGLDDAGYLTSTTALELKELPTSIAVIGANAIGLEMGQLFARLGSHVTFLEALPRIAPFEEPEISAALTDVLRDEGTDVHTGVTITRVDRENDARVLTFGGSDGTEQRLLVEQVLVATGRRPNTRGLGLAAAAVALTERGAVRVDDFLATTNPRIWAAGDVTGAPQFVYVAAAQGALAADNAIGHARRTMDWTALPRVTFTSPQLASTGMTEADAVQAGLQVETRTLGLDAVPRALVNRDTRGLFKIVADTDTGRVLGVHVLADNAGDVITAAVYAIKQRMTVHDLADTWAPYLTMAEGLKLTAQTFTRDVSRLSCCAA
jgi:mercuric reductase